MRFGIKVIFLGQYGSLWVNCRSFDDSKVKSDKRNLLSVPKNLQKDKLLAKREDLVKKFSTRVSMGHLRSF